MILATVLCVEILALQAVWIWNGLVSSARDTAVEETHVAGQSTAETSGDSSQTVVRILVPRYAAVDMSEHERQELAGIVQLEARDQCAEGQQAVTEVVLNRVISLDFPDTVHDVIHEDEDTPVPQFSTVAKLPAAKPGVMQYDAIDAALYGPSILPADVVFFSREGENDRVWGTIQDHVFYYQYIWE